MRRGSVVLVADRDGNFSGKPRPGLIVQSDLFNDHHASVTICPITSHLAGDDLFRLPVRAEPDNGLDRNSEVQVDKLQAVRRGRIGDEIGYLPDTAMVRVDAMLKRWLALV